MFCKWFVGGLPGLESGSERVCELGAGAHRLLCKHGAVEWKQPISL